MIAKRIEVYGQVQGVGFRWSTCREARRLGVNGWVKNRSDGAVEIHAEGEEAALDAFVAWAKRGPANARVERLEMTETRMAHHTGFTETV